MLLRKVEASGSDAARRATGEALLPVVLQAREAARVLALAFYDQQRTAHVTGPVFPHVAQPHYELAGLERELRRTLAGPNPAADAAASVVRHVEQAGRETITEQSRADPRAKAWARVASGRETCAFCMLLISRGPIYRNADFRAHNRCDCLAVPVFDTAEWPGRADHVRARAVWKRVAGDKSGKDALNAFRREYRDTTGQRETAAA